MEPRDVGIPANRLVLGKHSGRHAFRDRLGQLGHQVTDEQLDQAFERFKALADKKKEVFDEDLDAIVEDLVSCVTGYWELETMQTTAGTVGIPTATIELKNRDGKVFQDAGIGDGPVDAVYSTIQRICNITAKLTDYRLRAVTVGKDAQGEVSVEIEIDSRRIRGRGVSTDIIEASARAYLAAINRYLKLTDA